MKKILYLCSLIVLMSCTYTQDNALPTTKPVAKTWNSYDRNYENTDVNIPYLAWWQKFDDPVLNQLMMEGLVKNNQINMAMANVEASQGELKRVQLNWVPKIGSNLGYSSFPNLGFPGALVAAVPSYTLNIFSQIKEQKKAGYELESSKAASDAVKLAIIGQIANSYFNYSAQTERLVLLRQLKSDLSELSQISKAMYQTGLTSEINWQEALHEVSLIVGEEDVVQQNIVVSRNALCYLLDSNPHQIPLKTSFSQLKGNQIIVGSLPLTVVENRPDMIQAAQELRASNEGVGLAFSHLLPAVNLSVARGWTGTEPNSGQLGDWLNFNQALVQTPILDASVLGEVAREKGVNKASFYHYMDVLRIVMRDVNNGMSAHDLYTQRFDQVVDARNEEQIAYELNQKLYQRGINSYFQLLESRVQLDYLNLEVNQAQLEQFITIVNLYQDLAGGYKV